MRNIPLLIKPLLLFFLCLIFSSVFSQVTQQWVKRYNGPGNFLDEAKGMAIDASGNIYVTGSSIGSSGNSDYATIKYSPAGNEVWVKRYNGPAHAGLNEDGASSIAVDAIGNVYVTGYSIGNTSEQDFATVKYDTNGKMLWVRRYNGSGNGEDRPTSMAVDQSGNVYVTGRSFVNITNIDQYVTIKYNTDGKELWVKKYDGAKTLIGIDFATAIAVDTSGNVYVTGYSGEYFDDFYNVAYTTIKYNAQGKQLWVKKYLGDKGGSFPSSIAVDNAGGVYVTGGIAASSENFEITDYATVKYDTNGKQLWVMRYNGPGNFRDAPTSLTADRNGNVYVTGYSYGDSTGQDYATIKYDSKGKELWVSRYNNHVSNGTDYPTSISLDRSGNVYVTGYSGVNQSIYEYATIKYDRSGQQIWVKRYGSGNSFNAPSAIALDSAANVYVTGHSPGTGTSDDYATIRYVQTPPLTVNAGDDKTSYYLPFTPACIPLTAKAQGGSAPYKYSWSPGSATSKNTIVCPPKTTTYTVTVTDSTGLKATDEVKVDVIDVRCGSNKQNFLICHKGTTLCVTPWEAFWHFLHGDVVGNCAVPSITGIKRKSEAYPMP